MRRGGQLLIVFVAMVLVTGCVQRRLTIRSNPPGAFVWVDNYPIGTTPVSTDFTYYGKRQIRLVRDGYETLTVEQKIKAPWYEWFGIDFISENLVPANIRDEQSLDFNMVPQQVPSSPQLHGAGRRAALEQPGAALCAAHARRPTTGRGATTAAGHDLAAANTATGLAAAANEQRPMMLPPPQTLPPGQPPVSDGWQAPGAATMPPPGAYSMPQGAYAPPPNAVTPYPGPAMPPPNLVTPPAAPPGAAPTLPIR